MTPLRPARTLLRPVVSPVSDGARLELLEYFLAHHEDPSRHAHASLEWLARYAGVKRSAVLIVDQDAGLLIRTAVYGIAAEDVEHAVWPLDAGDPVVVALSATEPTVVRPGRFDSAAQTTPSRLLGAGPFTAVPLRGGRDDDGNALGLMLLRPANGPAADIAWVATVLGQKLEQIRGRGSLNDEVRKLRRERSLLFTIINAVTDPILLTDTEGRLIVANARAEKLFAASEEESEGRRRAVELNNMLFSAALSRSAVEGGAEARELLWTHSSAWRVHSPAPHPSR